MCLKDQIPQKNYHTRYEKIIQGRICYKKALQVVPVWGGVVIARSVGEAKKQTNLKILVSKFVPLDFEGNKIIKFRWFLGPSDHTPLLSKIWGI